MAITNKEILAYELATRGITEECNTYETWKFKGYQVQKGSKCLFQCQIWKQVNKKDKEGNESKKMIMVTASFFGLSQVESISQTA